MTCHRTIPSQQKQTARIGVLAATLVAVTIGLPAQAASPPDGPEDLPAPTSQMLAESVRVWGDGEVRQWVVDGHVTELGDTTTEGASTVVRLDTDILFAFGKATMPAAAPARITELVRPIPQGAAVQVIGHTDSIGDDASNLQLSRQRAEAVADAVAAARADLVLTVEGKGEAVPIEPNERGGQDNPAGREKNRRVEIRYQG